MRCKDTQEGGTGCKALVKIIVLFECEELKGSVLAMESRVSRTRQLERHFYGFEFSASVCPAGNGYSGVRALSCPETGPCETHRVEGRQRQEN